jgi:spermidine synthase
MQGLHLTADLYGCRCSPSLLTESEPIAALCRQSAERAGLTLVGERWCCFPAAQGRPGGVTGMLLLAESHLALHTWPEQGNVTLDVYVCNFSTDNSAKAESLMRTVVAAFAPARVRTNRLRRGEPDRR